MIVLIIRYKKTKKRNRTNHRDRFAVPRGTRADNMEVRIALVAVDVVVHSWVMAHHWDHHPF